MEGTPSQPRRAWTSVELVLPRGTTIEVGRVPAGPRIGLGTVEGLARMQLGARRRGCRLVVRHPLDRSCPLAELLDLVGLTGQLDRPMAEAARLLDAAGSTLDPQLGSPRQAPEL